MIAVITILHTYIAPELFFEDVRITEIMWKIRHGMTSDFLYPTKGLEFLVILLYYYCGRLYKNFNNRDMLKAMALFLILAVFQSRSNLFPAMLILGFTIINSRGINVYIKSFVAILSLSVLIFGLGDMIAKLLADTQRELSTSYNPRVVALDYFFDLKNKGIPEIIFGTGAISFQTSDYVSNLQAMHIHYSDLGFIGFWHQFGILPIGIFIYCLIRGFVKARGIPLYIKYIALHITICGATISYFDTPIRDIWFCLFYYLYWYYRVRTGGKPRKRIHIPSLSADSSHT